MRHQPGVLIIGGGIGGLVAALALQRAGINATVFERVAALHSYEVRRLKRANAIVRRSARIGQVAHWERPLAVKVRNTVFKKLPSQLLLQQLDWVLKEG